MTKGDDTRAAVLDAAMELASIGGLKTMSIGELAGLVGMSKSGLFAHFKSKEQLQLALIREGTERFIESVITPAIKQPRGEERLRALLEGWLRWELGEYGGGCPLYSASVEFASTGGAVKVALRSMQLDWFECIQTVIESAKKAEFFLADVDARQAAYEMTAYLTGFRHAYRVLELEGAEALLRASMNQFIDKYRR